MEQSCVQSERPALSCAMALLSCLYAREQYDYCKFDHADRLVQDKQLVDRISKFGSIMADLYEIDRQTVRIKDKMLGATSTRNGEPLIKSGAIESDYLAPVTDEVFVRLIRDIASASKRQSSMQDIRVHVPDLPETTPDLFAVVDSLSAPWGPLHGTLPSTIRYEFISDPIRSEWTRRLQILDSILRNHDPSKRVMDRLRSIVQHWSITNAMDELSARELLYRHASPEFWYLFVCPIAELSCKLAGYMERDGMCKQRLALSARSMSDLYRGILPAPTPSQCSAKVCDALLRLWSVPSVPLIGFDSCSMEQLLDRRGGSVLMGQTGTALAVHVFDEGGSVSYVIHTCSNGSCTVASCDSMSDASEIVGRGLGSDAGQVLLFEHE